MRSPQEHWAAMSDATSDRLDSWKAIASYLDRDAATVRRWEKTRGLPVRWRWAAFACAALVAVATAWMMWSR